MVEIAFVLETVTIDGEDLHSYLQKEFQLCDPSIEVVEVKVNSYSITLTLNSFLSINLNIVDGIFWSYFL